MASWVVADSGIFLSTVLTEPLTKKASTLIRLWGQQNIQIAAPVLFRYEIVAVIRKNTYRGLLTAEEASEKRELLRACLKIKWQDV